MIKLLSFMFTLLLAIGANTVQAAENQELPAIPEGQAQIVFMRSSMVNMLVGTTLHEVISGVPKLLGTISNNSKLLANLTPGEHIFMVGNHGSRDFLKATVSANHRYHVAVAAFWPGRFSPRPFRHANSKFLYGNSEFTSMLNGTKLSITSDEDRQKDEADSEKILGFYKNSWAKWQAKNDEEKAILTLNPEDFKD